MRQERIQKQKRPSPRRLDPYAVLPLDARDPDVVRVKRRLLESPTARRAS
jgi:hypothetical protein